jgi:hypothetical protein
MRAGFTKKASVGATSLSRFLRRSLLPCLILSLLALLFLPHSALAHKCPDDETIIFFEPPDIQPLYLVGDPSIPGNITATFTNIHYDVDNDCMAVTNVGPCVVSSTPAGYPGPGYYTFTATALLTDSAGNTHNLGSDKLKIGIIGVDLDVDSDNNNGSGGPDGSPTEDGMEEQPPGKFVFVNHNDDDNDGIPDYADPQIAGEGNLVRLRVSLAGFPSLSQVTVTYSYDGPPSVDLPAFKGQPIGNNMTNYTAAKQGTMRIWCRDNPGIERRPVFYVIPNHPYTLDELNYSGGNKTHLIEGINAAVNQMITLTVTFQGMTFTDRVLVSVVGPNLGLNNSNSTHDMDENTHDDLRPGVPDVDFEIDVPPGINATNEERRDEMLEDQGEGFQFWWSRDPPGTVTYMGSGIGWMLIPSPITEQSIVDVAPFVVDVPQALVNAGFKFYLKADGAQVHAYRAVSPGSNRRKYLQDVGTAANQRAEPAIPQDPYSWYYQGINLNITTGGANEFVFKVNGSGTANARLSLLAQDKGGYHVPVDSARLTLKDITNYWLFVSTRGSPVDNFNYPIDNGFVQINRYPYASTVSGTRDTAKTNHVIWVHGYNVDFDGARNTFNEMYRRLFWLGYRGNFVGLTWHSNEAGFWNFDPEVQNAFQTSPSVWRFLRDQVQVNWGVPPEHVNIITHSLGNLVVFDALRLHRRLGSGQLARNVCSLESATWPECYTNETAVAAAGGLTFGPDTITYPVDELQQHSWAFWFGQTGYEVPGALNGSIYHSFLPTDRVLAMMRENDYSRHEWHYFRNVLLRDPPVYRGPVGQNNLYTVIPTLMLPGARRLFLGLYFADQLNLPVGTGLNPMASVNYPAAAGGWQGPAGKLDWGSHSRYFNQSLPSIYNWYRTLLAGQGSPPYAFAPAIPIGEE